MIIGFIGLGTMGEPMCENVIKKSGQNVMVYDVNKSKIQELVKKGALDGISIKNLGENCSVIITMVPKGEHVKAVYNELIPNIKEESLLIEMSTIEPWNSIELSKEVFKKGCIMIDAPVVKSKPAAISGDLGIYVGGEVDAYKRALPILSCMGKNIIHMGENGKGLTMKILHNMLVSEIQNGVNETLVLAEELNLEMSDVVKAISYGGGQNFYLDSKKETISTKDYDPKFSTENMDKDVHIALEMAKRNSLNLRGLENSCEIYKTSMENNLGKLDFSVSLEAVKKLSKRKQN